MARAILPVLHGAGLKDEPLLEVEPFGACWSVAAVAADGARGGVASLGIETFCLFWGVWFFFVAMVALAVGRAFVGDLDAAGLETAVLLAATFFVVDFNASLLAGALDLTDLVADLAADLLAFETSAAFFALETGFLATTALDPAGLVAGLVPAALVPAALDPEALAPAVLLAIFLAAGFLAAADAREADCFATGFFTAAFLAGFFMGFLTSFPGVG